MSAAILIRPGAQTDLEEQRDYLETQNPVVADRYLESVEQTLEQLSRFPLMGRQRDYDHPRLSGMRMRPVRGFEKYLIFYLPGADGIEVVRVLHSARDIERIFATEP